MNPIYIQYFGYFASAIIAVSMTMNSIVKFRWINLCGASSFILYGFLFKAWPIVGLNLFIVSVDIFYLRRIYNKKELFATIEIHNNSQYMQEFLKFYKDAIDKIFPGFIYKPELNTISFFILRNMAIAGIFLAHQDKNDKTVLNIALDFVTPQYRDYKAGKFLYEGLTGWFIKSGFETLRATPMVDKEEKYLLRMGFEQKEKGIFEKQIYKTKMEK